MRARSRYGFIDAIRGAAACAVMLQHSLYQSRLFGLNPDGSLPGFIPNWLELGETGVVAFFLVSGFVIPLSLEKTSDFRLFWIHRALRIYPLYVLIFVLMFTLKAGGTINSFGSFLANAVSHLLFIQEYVRQEGFVGGSWTLSLEAVWYVSISSLFLVSLHKKMNWIVGAAVIVSFASQGFCAAGHHLPMGRLSMLLCCIIGLLCYRRSRLEVSSSNFGALFALLSTTIVLNLLVGLRLFPSEQPTATFQTAIDSWGLAFAIFFIPYVTRKSHLWGHSVFAFLGRISYSIYLLHAVVLFMLSKIDLEGFVLIAATFTFTIASSIVTYTWIELPPIRFGHTLKPIKPVDLQTLSAGS